MIEASTRRGHVILIAKTCTGCHRLLAADRFSVESKQALGRASRCKDCETKRVLGHQTKNTDQTKRYGKAWQRALNELRRRHRDEFAQLLRQEVDSLNQTLT